MRYSDHALEKMLERSVTEAEVLAIIANPVRGVYDPPQRDRREHFGYANGGRPVDVITNRAVTVVITVVLQ